MPNSFWNTSRPAASGRYAVSAINDSVRALRESRLASSKSSCMVAPFGLIDVLADVGFEFLPITFRLALHGGAGQVEFQQRFLCGQVLLKALVGDRRAVEI